MESEPDIARNLAVGLVVIAPVALAAGLIISIQIDEMVLAVLAGW